MLSLDPSPLGLKTLDTFTKVINSDVTARQLFTTHPPSRVISTQYNEFTLGDTVKPKQSGPSQRVSVSLYHVILVMLSTFTVPKLRAKSPKVPTTILGGPITVNEGCAGAETVTTCSSIHKLPSVTDIVYVPGARLISVPSVIYDLGKSGNEASIVIL